MHLQGNIKLTYIFIYSYIHIYPYTNNLHQEFNNICLNENLLKIYTYIYIYLNTAFLFVYITPSTYKSKHEVMYLLCNRQSLL